MAVIGRAPCDEAVARLSGTRAPARPGGAAWILAATILGSSMAFIDGSAVNVALPIIQSELHSTIVGAQWVVEAYLVFLSSLILVGGAIGDHVGRERVYAAGVIVFGAASAACALSPSIGWLIGSRAVQGVGAAMLIPESLAMLGSAFTPGDRGRAIGTWSAATTVVSAGGPVLGGWLAQHASWRWVFLLNIPIAVAVLAILWYQVPALRQPQRSGTPMRNTPIDFIGAMVITLAMSGLTFGLVQSSRSGLVSAVVLLPLIAGFALLVAFVAVEDRVARPLMPLILFRNRAFAISNLLTLLLYAAMAAALFFLPYDLIQVHHYSAAEAGAALLPMVALVGAFSRASAGLANRVGLRLPLALGSLLMAAGLAALAIPGVGGRYWETFFPGVVILGLGIGLLVTPLTTAVLSSVDDEFEGVASGVNNAIARAANLFGVAVLGLVVARGFALRLTDALAGIGLTPDVRQAVQRQALQLTAIAPPAGVDQKTRDAIDHAVAVSYVSAFRLGVLITAGLALAAAIIAALTLPARRRPAARRRLPRR